MDCASSTSIRTAFCSKYDILSSKFCMAALCPPRRSAWSVSRLSRRNNSTVPWRRPITFRSASTIICSSNAPPPLSSRNSEHVEDIVIVGGGIAGLSLALALHRLGVESVVLEQSEELTARGGSSLSIWNNGWKALEYLGVADRLREEFVKFSGVELYGLDGSCLVNFDFTAASRDVEVRAVERKLLLEALREPLPDSMFIYNAKVTGIRRLEKGLTEVECNNGYRTKTKVLIGCDGSRSVVARWMGFTEPRFAGYTATRGLAEFSEGHKMKFVTKQIVGQGVRLGFVPMNQTKLYWFVVFNSSATGEKITDPELVRKEAMNYAQECSDEMIKEAIKRTPSESLVRRTISDRWMWPVGGPSLHQGGVTLAGDAMHPITPNLGQGGCCALEDSVILARALFKGMNGGSRLDQIDEALKLYTDERWPRMLSIAIRSRVIGAIMQTDNGLFCSLRNFLLPKLVSNVDSYTSHTFYDCGSLDY